MKISTKTPQKSLDKGLLRFRPKATDFDQFKMAFAVLLGKIDNDEREDNQKTHVHDFLRDAFYKGINEINSKGTIDLAVHLGADKSSPLAVIVEAKSPGNKSEMLSVKRPNAKAFHELVLYYMRERIAAKNDELKYLIATNINEWFIFAASDFENYFYREPKFRKKYENWRDNQLVNSNTDHFYNEIAKPFIDELDKTLECTYFDLREFRGQAGALALQSKNLIALYKLLSPYHLLRTKFTDDSNTLDKRFYTELLHIIGLEEYKERSKTLIRRKEMRDEGSLIEKAIDKLETEYFDKDQEMWKTYGLAKDEQVYNAALELCIVWINRILFLKLLEAQLLGYHDNLPEYRFLNIKTVNNLNELYVLFHDVLNRTPENRRPGIAEKYVRVPYLNSSLFDFAEVESNTIKVSTLDDNGNLGVLPSSILKKINKTATSLPTLEYLFRFLDAYDFASEGKEDIQNENRKLINASVLGKVFEKINGYKDGSIYTPGFITMYMCRQAIRLAVVQKFKDEGGFDGADFDELSNWIKSRNYQKENIKRFNEIIDSLKICDPAVGSGHFLVSALNEMLAIKSELGIFADDEYKTFGDYTIAIDNDELIIVRRSDNTLFEYKVPDGKTFDAEMQRLQRTLFHEKQKLIENCLFGVDINPNSVKICRLRLWIELLKNAYYKFGVPPPSGPFRVPASAGLLPGEEPPKGGTQNELKTLPNIDINIKEGNSLISRFGLQDKFKSEAINTVIEKYRRNTLESKNVKEKARKEELKRDIRNLKLALSSSLDDETTEIIDKKKKKEQQLFQLNSPELFEKHTDYGREVKTQKLTAEIAKLDADLVKIETKSANAFEWRFEFPEVLADDGRFFGFDMVIGNPPYIESRSSVLSETVKDVILKGIQSRHLNDGHLITRGADILVYFYERALSILNSEGYVSYITQNAWLDTDYGLKFQRFLRRNTHVLGVYDNDIKSFDESANINTIITLFKGTKSVEDLNTTFAKFNVGFDVAPYDPKVISQSIEIGLINNVSPRDAILNEFKWGIILNSDKLIIDLHNRLYQNESEIRPAFRIGQGLNITKDHYADIETIQDLEVSDDSLIAFFTSDDGAPFAIQKTTNFLFDESKLSRDEKRRLKLFGLSPTIINKQSRETPTLVLPRGVGRYFCASNMCDAYTSSFVEIYLEEDANFEINMLSLWTFLNSSVGWLIREISGRKNLGGGMLKAEATDLKNYPIFFNLKEDFPKMQKIYQKLKTREAAGIVPEIDSSEHQEIDNIIYRQLGYSENERKLVTARLIDLITFRTEKSKT